MAPTNPYNWQLHNPTAEIPRAEVGEVVATLLRGGGAVVLGGRGMGKSVLLGQVARAVEGMAGLRVLLVETPPPELTVRACLDMLADLLGVGRTASGLGGYRQQLGPSRRAALEEALEPATGPLDLDLVDVLHLLQAAGLVRVEGSVFADDPLMVFPIAGILNLPVASASTEGLREHLTADLVALLTKLHGSSADFFRPGPAPTGTTAAGKRLVPESVFAAHLALGFELLGWRSEREAQSAAGRTDVKLRRNHRAEVAVVEVKIWGRSDYREAQSQVESYWTADVAAAAVVQITDADLPDWPQRYRSECLHGSHLEVEQLPLSDSPIRAHFACRSTTSDGMTAEVDHFLLRLPRRR